MILKTPRFVQFGANLTKFGPPLAISAAVSDVGNIGTATLFLCPSSGQQHKEWGVSSIRADISQTTSLGQTPSVPIFSAAYFFLQIQTMSSDVRRAKTWPNHGNLGVFGVNLSIFCVLEWFFSTWVVVEYVLVRDGSTWLSLSPKLEHLRVKLDMGIRFWSK